MWADFSFALSAAGFLLSVAACFVAAAYASRVLALQEHCKRFAESLKASSNSSLVERVTAVEDAMELLANRVKMQRVRAAAVHAEKQKDELPDPYRNPDEWRRVMNARLQKGKLGL